MQAILFAIISYIGWGSGDIFGAVSTRKIGAYSTSFWVAVIGVLVFSLYIPFAVNDLRNLNLYLFILILVLGFLYTAVNVMINTAFQISNVSLVGTIFSSFAAFTTLFSLVFMKERINLNQMTAILVVFLGVFISTVNFREFKKSHVFTDKGVGTAFVAMICASLYFTFIKIPVAKVGWFWPNYMSILLFPSVLIYMKLRKIKLVWPNMKNAFLPLLICTVLLRSGDFSFNIAISRGLTSIVAPIAGAYPTLFAVLSFLIFRDRIQKQQLAGIIITLVGIAALSAVSM